MRSTKRGMVDIIQGSKQRRETPDILSVFGGDHDPAVAMLGRMDEIQAPVRGPARDDDPPVNCRVVASPFADDRREVLRGVNPVEQELTLAVRYGPRRKAPKHLVDKVGHFQEPAVTRSRVTWQPLR
jgi:hypothetical protein